MARLLFVEDDADTREATSGLLAICGHEVLAVGSVAEALLSSPESFDVILTDLNMPVTDGVEFKRLLDQRGCRVPVIVVSGEAEVARIALQLGAIRAVRKPAALADLEAAIAAAQRASSKAMASDD